MPSPQICLHPHGQEVLVPVCLVQLARHSVAGQVQVHPVEWEGHPAAGQAHPVEWEGHPAAGQVHPVAWEAHSYMAGGKGTIPRGLPIGLYSFTYLFDVLSEQLTHLLAIDVSHIQCSHTVLNRMTHTQ